MPLSFRWSPPSPPSTDGRSPVIGVRATDKMNSSRWGRIRIFISGRPTISLCLDRQDAGELRDLARDIVIMDEICHLRWHLLPLLRSLSPSVVFSFWFFYSFFNGPLRIAWCVAPGGRSPSSLPVLRLLLHIPKMRDANGRLSRNPRHPRDRGSREIISPAAIFSL